MEELLRYLVKSIVDGEFDIITSEEDGKLLLTVNVQKKEIGKVIGKNGKVAMSIRTIIRSATMKENKKFLIKFGERVEA